MQIINKIVTDDYPKYIASNGTLTKLFYFSSFWNRKHNHEI